jgi:hypothetical protein
MHYWRQNYIILQSCLRIYLCDLYDLPNELLFQEASLPNILCFVFFQVITVFLNITCKNIWIVDLKRPPYRTHSYGANRLTTINT